MKIKNIFDIAGRAMAAQMVRLNTISSNLANAGATTGDPETVYKPLKPEFKTQYSENVKKNGISTCLLYTSPSPRDATLSRMPSSA